MKKVTTVKKKELDIVLIEDKNVNGLHKITINGETILVSSNIYHIKDIYNWIIFNANKDK